MPNIGRFWMAASDLESIEIAERIQRNPDDNEAKADLVAHCAHLVDIAVRRIPPAYRRDVVQDSWVRVFAVLQRFDRGRASVHAVVQGCARLAVLEFWRQFYRNGASTICPGAEQDNPLGDALEYAVSQGDNAILLAPE